MIVCVCVCVLPCWGPVESCKDTHISVCVVSEDRWSWPSQLKLLCKRFFFFTTLNSVNVWCHHSHQTSKEGPSIIKAIKGNRENLCEQTATPQHRPNRDGHQMLLWLWHLNLLLMLTVLLLLLWRCSRSRNIGLLWSPDPGWLSHITSSFPVC